MRLHNGFPVYEVGTVVRLVTKRKDDGRVVYVPAPMEGEFGKVVTIEEVNLNRSAPTYEVVENGWTWDNSLIEGEECVYAVADDDEEIAGASFGDYLNHFRVVT